MAIIDVKVKIACGEDISEAVIDAILKEEFRESIARNLSVVCDTDNLAVETVGVPEKRLV